MTTIRLDCVSPSGMKDIENWCNINIDRETYDTLPVYSEIEDLSMFPIKKTTFSDNVRDSLRFNVIHYPALEITGYADYHSLFIVWIETEKIWIVFDCEDYFPEEYGPVLCNALKVDKIYRITDYMKDLIKSFYPDIS